MNSLTLYVLKPDFIIKWGTILGNLISHRAGEHSGNYQANVWDASWKFFFIEILQFLWDLWGGKSCLRTTFWNDFEMANWRHSYSTFQHVHGTPKRFIKASHSPIHTPMGDSSHARHCLSPLGAIVDLCLAQGHFSMWTIGAGTFNYQFAGCSTNWAIAAPEQTWR